jgi:hypothetical protein
MSSFILLIALLQLPTQGVSACRVAKPNMVEANAPLTIKQICGLENRMSLLSDGMSWKTAMKTLGISRKHLPVIAHGAAFHRYLGSGYELVSPFHLQETPMRLLLLDREGKIVKDVSWH